VIVRDDLIGRHREETPTMPRYDIHAKNNSLYNTPPTYSIYICKLVLEWLKELGGVKEIEKINERKARALYDYLDGSKLFRATVTGKDRSIMNIPFVTGDETLGRSARLPATSSAYGPVTLPARAVQDLRVSATPPRSFSISFPYCPVANGSTCPMMRRVP